MATPQPSRKTTPVRLFSHRDWQQCFEDFIRSLSNKSGSTTTPYCYERVLRRFFTDPSRTPDTYTRAEVEAFLHATTAGHKRSGTPPKPNTFNNRLVYLRSFYAYAANYSVLFRGKLRPLFRNVSPLHGISHVSEDAQSNRTLTVEMIGRIFAVIPRDTIKGLRDRALLLSYFWTGRRRAEIANLRWADIEQGVLFDNGKVGTRYHWRGKGRARQDDSAELPPRAWNAIKAYLEMAGRWDHMQPSDPIFISVSTSDKYQPTQPIHANSINFIFREYLALAGIDNDGGRIGIHSWRHSAAFVRWQEKQDLAVLQKFLRHKNPGTTIGYIEEWTRQADTATTALEAKYGHF